MDLDRILSKITELETYIVEIYELTPETHDEFIHSLKDRRSVERELQIMIECVVDVCFMLNKIQSKSIPAMSSSIFDSLPDNFTNIDNLKSMKKFRNVLVHKYSGINYELVFKFAKENIQDFEEFIDDVKKYVELRRAETEIKNE